MESSCDSDPYGVQALPPDESDIEAQLFIDEENANKQDIIDNLQKELSICKVQFEQSVAINKKLENVHNKNSKLAIALRNLQSEKEELVRRLDISIKANEDLESKLNNERFISSQQISKESTEKDKELAKIKKDYETTIEAMTKKIEALETQNQNLELNNKMLSSKVDRLLQNSNQYFGLTFSEVDSLLEFLIQPRVKEIIQQEEPKAIVDNDAIFNIEKKNRLLKQRLKDFHIQNEKFAKENDQLRKKIQEAEKRNTLIIEKYEDQIEQIKEDDLNNMSLLNDTTDSLNTKLQKLKNENKTLKNELNELRSQKVTSPPDLPLKTEKTVQIQTENKHVTFQEELDFMNQKNLELSEKLQISEKKNDHLSTQIKELHNSKDQLEIECENQKASLNALKVVHDETLNEVQALRESLHTKSITKPPKPIEKRILLKLKAKADHYKKTIRLLTQQTQDLQMQIETDKNRRISIESQLNNKQAEFEELQQKHSSLSDELNLLKNKLEEKPSLTAEDIIPSYAWRFNDFDPNLTQRIEKVAINPLLQPVSKLSSVYKIIQKFYADELKTRDDSIQKLTDDIQNLKGRMNKFIVDISVFLSLNPMTISDFLNSNCYSDTIVQKLSSLTKENENLKRKDACYSTLVDMLVKYFNVNGSNGSVDFYSSPESFQSLLSDLKNQTVSLTQRLKLKSRKYRTIKLYAKDLKRATDLEINELKSALKTKSNEVLAMKQNSDILCEMNQKLKRELHSAKKSLAELQRKSDENESLMQDEFDKKMLNAQTVHNQSEQSLRKQVDLLMNEKESSRLTIENCESTISHLRQLVDKNQQEIKEKDQIILNLNNEQNTVVRSIEAKFKQEKEQLIRSNEKVVSEMKKQCDNQRNDLMKISEELSTTEKKNRICKQSIVSLKKDKIKLENEIKNVYDQIKRERQINEADLANKILSNESTFSMKLNECKNKFENEKKRIFSYAANEFRQFFNPSESIDEKSFRYLILKIKKEYDRLLISDANVRRLVGADPNQPTEEAVAHLLS